MVHLPQTKKSISVKENRDAQIGIRVPGQSVPHVGLWCTRTDMAGDAPEGGRRNHLVNRLKVHLGAGGGGVGSSVVEHRLRIHEALGSIPRPKFNSI